ncbi:MAG: hypothetical protein JW860_04695 [Sedimentisphaerales bacterium]|nr:hypothetical protein [Sedimentisphaerales bacterium]
MNEVRRITIWAGGRLRFYKVKSYFTHRLSLRDKRCHPRRAYAARLSTVAPWSSLGLALSGLIMFMGGCWDSGTAIDRYGWVHRHIPRVEKAEGLSPFTVGNGEFAFTVDVTGLQTFDQYYESGIPLGTHAQWGWHTIPSEHNYSLDDTFDYYDTYGRQVSYAGRQHSDAGQWLRANPHRLHLGKIGLDITKEDGGKMQLSDITDIRQSADIWEGIIKSSFTIEDMAMQVETGCHPQFDQVGVRMKSELLAGGRLGITFDFPYGSLSWGKQSTDWDSPDKHTSRIHSTGESWVVIERKLDADTYFVEINWQGAAEFKRRGDHAFVLAVQGGREFKFTCRFLPESDSRRTPDAEETFAASKSHWQEFWTTGGAVDLSGSRDHRWGELERRIVLSRYLTAVQCAGSMPPAETGLTCNSWYGKFHLEMHWWHGVHFVLWGQKELFEKSLSWYERILPMARAKAKRQGYAGCRWPKMVGYDGRESPSTVGVFLIWQQPHPIYYAEVLYRACPEQSVLDRYQEIVFATAEFMASYAHWDEASGRYVLGPPLIPAQEIYKPAETMNPGFELSYWAFGLKTAQIWRERLGLARVEKWDHVIEHLSELPAHNGLYQNTETALDTFERESNRRDHPTLLASCGMLPGEGVDTDRMRDTLAKVMQTWDWQHTWGWDYPLVAMTAARVGRGDLAIDALLMDVPKNTYLNNGHNYQDERLTLYLPGNGGLLTAVAMMAAGWDGCVGIHAPGFPQNGNWEVKWEGLSRLP